MQLRVELERIVAMIHLITLALILVAMVAAWQLPPEPSAIMGALLTISLVPQMVKED